MAEVGIFLSSEEHGPNELVEAAQLAERAGWRKALISDHFHPWIDRQGESPFVWSVIAAIGATTGLEVTTGVTCPTVRTHPAIIAHAAATSALTCKGGFRLGVGTGPKVAAVKVCWGEDEVMARKLAFELWPTTGVSGELSQELPMPAHFEQACELVTEDDVAGKIPCGPDPARHIETIKKYVEA